MPTPFLSRSLTPGIPPLREASEASFASVLARILSRALPLKVSFQPVVDLQQGVVAGYEALVNFPPAMGPSTEACFKAARRVGKHLQLEEVVTRTILGSRLSLPPNCFLSINVSQAFLVSQAFEKILAASSSLAGLVIEVTADESIADYDSIRHTLAKIRSYDGFVALDHAGAVCATLKNFLEFKPNFIKLDREFVDNCNSDRPKSVLVELMGQAANRLDAWLIADGIETQLDLNELIDLKVPLGQGNFLGSAELSIKPLAEHRAGNIRSRARKFTSTNRLTSYVEACSTQPTLEAAHQVLANSVARTVVITDEWGRPTQMIERHPLIGVRTFDEFMKAQISSDSQEILLRALTRPQATRFDPIVVINNRGLMQGVVRIENLVRGIVKTDPIKK